MLAQYLEFGHDHFLPDPFQSLLSLSRCGALNDWMTLKELGGMWREAVVA
jgi:hypothetical protein